MIKIQTVLFCGVISVSALTAHAADLTGKWTAEFDSQVGLQKYTFTLRQDGTNLTGKASSEIGGQTREADLKEGKVDGEKVSFVETLNFQGNEIPITYNGKVSTNEIKFTREVGDFAKEEIVARRDSAAAEPTASPENRRGRGERPIVLGPDDKAVFPPAPEGFDQARGSIAWPT